MDNIIHPNWDKVVAPINLRVIGNGPHVCVNPTVEQVVKGLNVSAYYKGKRVSLVISELLPISKGEAKFKAKITRFDSSDDKHYEELSIDQFVYIDYSEISVHNPLNP